MTAAAKPKRFCVCVELWGEKPNFWIMIRDASERIFAYWEMIQGIQLTPFASNLRRTEIGFFNKQCLYPHQSRGRLSLWKLKIELSIDSRLH